MHNIYLTDSNIEYWLGRSGLVNYNIITNLDHWLACPNRISMHEEIYFEPANVARINHLIEHSDLCILFVPELINETWFDQFDRPNVVFFMAGNLNITEHETDLLEQDQLYAGRLHLLLKNLNFRNSYRDVKDPSWPDLDQLEHTQPVPRHIIDEVQQHLKITINDGDIPEQYKVPVPIKPPQSRLQSVLTHHLFADFYQAVCDPSWPSLEQLQTMPNPPANVVDEILSSFQAPEEQDPYHRIDSVADVMKINTKQRRLEHAEVFLHRYFFWSTVDFYHRQPQVLGMLDHTLPKPKTFDILLGRKKKHRDLIYDQVDHKNNVVTYFGGKDPDLANCDSRKFIWPESVLPATTVSDTTDIVRVNGVIVSLSQIVPTDIYNQTAYTLVCESQCENGFSFFTEKIIKPMLARRIFVVCSGKDYLANLHKLGFKTFDNIFDESYDQAMHMEQRVQRLIQTVFDLGSRDQVKLYHQAEDILEHNYQLLMSQDWQQLMCNDIKSCIVERLCDK